MTTDTLDSLDEKKSYKDLSNIKSYKEEPLKENLFEDSYNLNNKLYYHNLNKIIPQNNQIQITVFDVAAYIVEKLGEISTMKLQKLVYYSQAWSIVWDEKPLFNEKILAWANGPVIRELFDYHRGNYSINKIIIGNSLCLSSSQKETIDAVLNYYGDKPAQWLIDLTHMEKPWLDARKGLSASERGNREILLESLHEYYSSL